MGLGTLKEVQDRSGYRLLCSGGSGKTGCSRTNQGTFEEVREGSETLGEVGDSLGTLKMLRDESREP